MEYSQFFYANVKRAVDVVGWMSVVVVGLLFGLGLAVVYRFAEWLVGL